MQLGVNIATLQEAVGQVVYGKVGLGIRSSTRARCFIGGRHRPYNAIQ